MHQTTSISDTPPFVTDELTWDGTTASYSHWIKRGMMLISRDALDHDDPDLLYNLLKRHGLDPSSFNIEHPQAALFVGKSRQELIDLILETKRELEAYQRMFG